MTRTTPGAAAPTQSAQDDVYPKRSRAIYALSLFMLAAVIGYLDRQIINLMVDPIKGEFGISDSQISLLQGIAFALFYTTFGLPVGALVDKMNRRNLLVIGITLWSAATVGCGLAQSYSQLFFARLCVGFGEAFLYPACYSMIADYFHPSVRGRAFSAFGFGGAVGGGLSYIFGSLVVIAVSGSAAVAFPFFGELTTWRAAFVIVGVPGLFMALLLLTIRDAPRQTNSATPAGAGQRLREFVRSSRGALGSVFLTYGLLSAAGVGAGTWMVAGFIRRLGVEPSTAGFMAGFAALIGVTLGAILGGILADRAASLGLKGGRLRVATFSALLTVPCFLLQWATLSPAVTLVGTLAGFVFITSGLTTGAAALNDLVPNQLRGRMSAFYVLVNGLVGWGLGPTAIALVTDHVLRDPHAVGFSILIVCVPVLLAAAATSRMGFNVYDAAMYRLDRNPVDPPENSPETKEK